MTILIKNLRHEHEDKSEIKNKIKVASVNFVKY